MLFLYTNVYGFNLQHSILNATKVVSLKEVQCAYISQYRWNLGDTDEFISRKMGRERDIVLEDEFHQMM